MSRGMRCEQRWTALTWLGVGMPNLAGETRFDNECRGGNGRYAFPFLFLKSASKRSREHPSWGMGELGV